MKSANIVGLVHFFVLTLIVFSPDLSGGATAWGPMRDIEAAARKEGRLILYVGGGFTNREAEGAIGKIFQERYGVTIDWSSMPARDIPVRVAAERRTGIHVADLVMIGFSGNYTNLKPAGLLAPILAPSTLEKGVWHLEPAWLTPDSRDYLFYKIPLNPTFLINTRLVPAGQEPKSYQDLLNPKWKGKIVLQTPAIGGSGSGWFDATYRTLGLDYMRALAKQVVLVQNPPESPDAVARGQYPIAIAAITQRALPLLKEGAPLKFLHPVEGGYLSESGISFIEGAPHPNAARLFLHWFFTKEGQTVFAQTLPATPVRKDVPQDHLPEGLRYVEGMRLLEKDLEDMLKPERTQARRELAKQIFEGK
jgi:iron(III) transport system substrate-binding protein